MGLSRQHTLAANSHGIKQSLTPTKKTSLHAAWCATYPLLQNAFFCRKHIKPV
jgi:hypothetical protein